MVNRIDNVGVIIAGLPTINIFIFKKGEYLMVLETKWSLRNEFYRMKKYKE